MPPTLHFTFTAPYIRPHDHWW